MDNFLTNAMKTFKDMTDKVTNFKLGDRDYIKRGYDPVMPETVSNIQTHTLQSVVDAIAAKIDKESIGKKLFIHVSSPTQVSLLSESFGPFLQRHPVVTSIAYTTDFSFGYDHTPEEFIIALNSQFIDSQERTDLLKLCSSITKESSGTVADNGVSQSVEIKAGISMRDKVEIKNPFTLSPYRTFPEIDQPASDFVFRIKEKNGVSIALYEADGSKWKMEAINSIKDFFKNSKECKDVPIIA